MGVVGLTEHTCHPGINATLYIVVVDASVSRTAMKQRDGRLEWARRGGLRSREEVFRRPFTPPASYRITTVAFPIGQFTAAVALRTPGSAPGRRLRGLNMGALGRYLPGMGPPSAEARGQAGYMVSGEAGMLWTPSAIDLFSNALLSLSWPVVATPTLLSHLLSSLHIAATREHSGLDLDFAAVGGTTPHIPQLAVCLLSEMASQACQRQYVKMSSAR